MGINERQDWRSTLKSGDAIIYEISTNFEWDVRYYEDIVKEVKDKCIITTEGGVTFVNGTCYRNGRTMNIENPENDYFFEEKPYHRSYMESKRDGKVRSIGDKLNNAIRRSWTELHNNGTKLVEDDAYMERKYRNKDNKVDYFSSLSPCIGVTIKNGSLYFQDVLMFKKCSHKIGKYLVYRKAFDEFTKPTIWSESLIYVYNSDTEEIRQDMTGFISNTRYWLEWEHRSVDLTFKVKLDPYLSSRTHQLGVFEKQKLKKEQFMGT